jgi:hypothetical protein
MWFFNRWWLKWLWFCHNRRFGNGFWSDFRFWLYDWRLRFRSWFRFYFWDWFRFGRRFRRWLRNRLRFW